jgi:hypothetical protein
LLAADDRWIEALPFEARPGLRDKAHHQHRDDDEMQETVGRHEGLVVRVEGRDQPVREHRAEIGEATGKGHDHRKDKIGDAEIECRA